MLKNVKRIKKINKKDGGDGRGDDRGGYDKTQECTRWRKRQISGSRNVRLKEKLTNLEPGLIVAASFLNVLTFSSSHHRQVSWEKVRRSQLRFLLLRFNRCVSWPCEYVQTCRSRCWRDLLCFCISLAAPSLTSWSQHDTPRMRSHVVN